MASVADLLALSRAAHLEYRRQSPRMTSVRGQLQAVPGDPVAARAAMDAAATALKQAHEADPELADPAWAGTDVHALLTFYGEKLAS